MAEDDIYREGWIRNIVSEELKQALGEHKTLLTLIASDTNKAADGAQAQIFSAAILHGDARLGLRGFVPEMRERMEAVESQQRSLQEAHSAEAQRNVDREKKNDTRHVQNLRRFRMIETSSQRMRRILLNFWKWCTAEKDESNWSRKRIAGFIVGTILVLDRIRAWWPTLSHKVMAAWHSLHI